MRVLFVVPYVPNPIRIRPFNFVRGLERAGHQVTVFTLWTSEQDLKDVARLRAECYRVLAFRLSRVRAMLNCARAIPTRLPVQAAYSWQPQAGDALAALVRDGDEKGPFDIIHLEHLRSARYALRIKDLSQVGSRCPPMIWDSVDCITSLFRMAKEHSLSRFGRWVPKLELSRTSAFEGSLAAAFPRVLVTAKPDAEALAGLMPPGSRRDQIRVVPNGIDLDYFAPDPAVARDPNRIVMSGKMSYHANVTMAVHFVRTIWPGLRRRQPGLKLWIVGKDPAREVLALQDGPGIEVTGTVDDIRPYLRQAALAVAPLVYAVGIQNKVLEAMACATPTVISEAAAAGLQLETGTDALVALPDGHFAEAVMRLLDGPEIRGTLGHNGRRYVERFHSWQLATSQLEEHYVELITPSN
ncbi:MAG: glycosyltransferase [Anaerolineales bacterium]